MKSPLPFFFLDLFPLMLKWTLISFLTLVNVRHFLLLSDFSCFFIANQQQCFKSGNPPASLRTFAGCKTNFSVTIVNKGQRLVPVRTNRIHIYNTLTLLDDKRYTLNMLRMRARMAAFSTAAGTVGTFSRSSVSSWLRAVSSCANISASCGRCCNVA